MPVGTDRYPVAPDPRSELEERIRQLEQQVAELARRNPLNDGMFRGTLRNVDAAGNTVVTIGPAGFVMYDSTGVLRARVGYINPTAGYGMSVFDANGGLRFEVNDAGYRDPWLAHPIITASALTNVTSATFVDVYQAKPELITHEGVSVTVVYAADVGTTGELRLTNVATGQSTDVLSIGSGANSSVTFQWLHGSTLGAGPVRFDLESRRTGGGGNVVIYQPYELSLADPVQCTAGGL